MRRLALKRIFIALAAFVVLSAATTAICWKPLLIEWHKREIVRLEAEAGQRYSRISGDEETLFEPSRISDDPANPRPLQYRTGSLFRGWPDELAVSY